MTEEPTRKEATGKGAQCVYCLRLLTPALRTQDHVIARSWFPLSTPQNVEKWKVPSCRPCNHKFGKVEEDILHRLAMSLDRNDIAAAGIVETALRSIDPKQGKTTRDREHRQRKREKLRRELVTMRAYTYTRGLLKFPQK